MHDPVTVMDTDYEWPRCTACTRDLWETETGRHACRPCEDRAALRLRELGPLFGSLNTTGALLKGSSRPGGGGGTKTAPLPLNATALSLVAVGGIATRLCAIEDAWRQALGRRIGSWAGAPREAVPAHLAFIRINLEWACTGYAEVAQDLEEIRRLHSEATAALAAERRPGRVKVGHCPTRFDNGDRCGQPLTATAANTRIHCGNCGARWDGMDAWRALRRAQDAMYAEMATAAA